MPFQAALLSIKPAPAARSAATKFLFWGTGAAAEATCAKALRAECPLGEEKDYGPGPGIWHKSPETVGASDPSSFQKHAKVAAGSPLPGSLARPGSRLDHFFGRSGRDDRKGSDLPPHEKTLITEMEVSKAETRRFFELTLGRSAARNSADPG